jgi:hypothetical protein
MTAITFAPSNARSGGVFVAAPPLLREMRSV